MILCEFRVLHRRTRNHTYIFPPFSCDLVQVPLGLLPSIVEIKQSMLVAAALLVAVVTASREAAMDRIALGGGGVHVGQAPCSRNGYLAPIPASMTEFNERVVAGPHVHLVRVHNESVLRDVQFASTWEKLAIIYHKKLKIVKYQPGGPDRRFDNRMAAELGVAEDDVPYLVLYDGLPPLDEPAAGNANGASGAAAAGADEASQQRVRVTAAECAAGVEAPSECAGFLDDGVVTDESATGSAAGGGETDEAAKDDDDEGGVSEEEIERRQLERLQLMHHRRLGTDTPSSVHVGRQYSHEAAERTRRTTPSFELIRGGGSSYGLLYQAIEARLEGLRTDEQGFFLKRRLPRRKIAKKP